MRARDIQLLSKTDFDYIEILWFILKPYFYFYYHVKLSYWNNCHLFPVRFYEFFIAYKCAIKLYLLTKNQVQEEETMWNIYKLI